jgi:hypothetical protein
LLLRRYYNPPGSVFIPAKPACIPGIIPLNGRYHFVFFHGRSCSIFFPRVLQQAMFPRGEALLYFCGAYRMIFIS